MKKIMLSLLMSTLLFGEAFAADDDMHTMHDKVVFSTATGTLMIPEVHVQDAEGNTTGMVSAKLIVIKAEGSIELQVTELIPVVNEPKVDEFGCVFPQTWHEAMNHCMVQ